MIHEFQWFSKRLMTWCKFRLVKPCWRGFSPISLMWGCRVFPARDFCLPVWGGNEGCRDQFSSAGEYEKKLKGLYLWRCLVKPGNIWWCTLFLRSYVHVNESQLFLIMCVLWLAHTISFLFFILLKKKKRLYAQHGPWTHDPQVKGHTFYRLSQPGALEHTISWFI